MLHEAEALERLEVAVDRGEVRGRQLADALGDLLGAERRVGRVERLEHHPARTRQPQAARAQRRDRLGQRLGLDARTRMRGCHRTARVVDRAQAVRSIACTIGRMKVELPRLTQRAAGGGCACKVPAERLSELLQGVPRSAVGDDRFLVGNDTLDDAAVVRLNDEQAIVQTVDVFTPIVDDAYDYGRIAATNAISDVFAMGGEPLFALAIGGFPGRPAGRAT